MLMYITTIDHISFSGHQHLQIIDAICLAFQFHGPGIAKTGRHAAQQAGANGPIAIHPTRQDAYINGPAVAVGNAIIAMIPNDRIEILLILLAIFPTIFVILFSRVCL